MHIKLKQDADKRKVKRFINDTIKMARAQGKFAVAQKAVKAKYSLKFI